MATLAEAFGKMEAAMAADSSLAATVKGVLQFELGAEYWTVDCSGAGKVTQGKAAKADCTVTMAEKDFLELFAGKLNGMSAYMSGKMKVCPLCALLSMAAALADSVPFASTADQGQHGPGAETRRTH